MGEIRILDETGDTKVLWNSDNDDEIDAARETFNRLTKKGYAAFEVSATGKKGKKVDTFDPNAERLIMAPMMAGG